MKYFDMHCDTLSRCVDEGFSLEQNKGHIDMKRLSAFDEAVQFFAAYINTYEYEGDAAAKRFEEQKDVLKNYKNPYENVHPVLTVENISCINGDADRVYYLKECGVKASSLVWNGFNGIAGGIDSDDSITPLGYDTVKRLEECDIVIDCSHLNDTSFYALEKCTTKPFIATHSNAREICGVSRNLTDDQLKCIFERGGVVGLNFYIRFICDPERVKQDYLDNFLRHIEHMFSLGGERFVALGSDFDGSDVPDEYAGLQYVNKLYDAVAAHFSKKDADNIFFNNAYAFFKDKI